MITMASNIVFKLNIKNSRTNPFEINYYHFCVMVTSTADPGQKLQDYMSTDFGKLKNGRWNQQRA